MQYVGIDWAYRRARWCAKDRGGRVLGEDWMPADEDGLARLVGALGCEVNACVEMFSGAAWVRDRLTSAGWHVQIADARKVKAVASLAVKTDIIDARVLAELSRRELVPELWVPSLDDRALKERLLRRMHLVRLRTSAKNRAQGVLTQWGVKLAFKRLAEPDALERLERRGVPEVWRRSVAEAVAVVELLDARLRPLERELHPLALADPRVELLRSIPGLGDLLGLTFAAEIGDVSRFPTARKLVGYSALPANLAIRGALPHGPALQGRPRPVAMGRGRGRPERLPSDQPLACALPRREEQDGREEQPGEGRGGPQDPDRRMACAEPARTLQAFASTRRDCHGKLPLRSGRGEAQLRI